MSAMASRKYSMGKPAPSRVQVEKNSSAAPLLPFYDGVIDYAPHLWTEEGEQNLAALVEEWGMEAEVGRHLQDAIGDALGFYASELLLQARYARWVSALPEIRKAIGWIAELSSEDCSLRKKLELLNYLLDAFQYTLPIDAFANNEHVVDMALGNVRAGRDDGALEALHDQFLQAEKRMQPRHGAAGAGPDTARYVLVARIGMALRAVTGLKATIYTRMDGPGTVSKWAGLTMTVLDTELGNCPKNVRKLLAVAKQYMPDKLHT